MSLSREFKCLEVLNWSQKVVQSRGLLLKTGKSHFGSLELTCKSKVFGFMTAPMLLRELFLPWLALTLSKLRLNSANISSNSQVTLSLSRTSLSTLSAWSSSKISLLILLDCSETLINLLFALKSLFVEVLKLSKTL